MFQPKLTHKDDPAGRWQQSDRIFFGFGACHILAGVFLLDRLDSGVWGEWIVPIHGLPGNHMYVTDGTLAFDYHGYTQRTRLLQHYWKGQTSRNHNWEARIVTIDFPLLDTLELNKRQHRGPDQYCGDPITRARRFIASIKPRCSDSPSAK